MAQYVRSNSSLDIISGTAEYTNFLDSIKHSQREKPSTSSIYSIIFHTISSPQITSYRMHALLCIKFSYTVLEANIRIYDNFHGLLVDGGKS